MSRGSRRAKKPSRSRTVFGVHSSAIVEEINFLQTELVKTNFTLTDVEVGEAVRYCVRDDHIPSLHKAYTLTQSRSMTNYVRYNSWLHDTNANLDGLHIEFMVRGSHADTVLVPDYACNQRDAPKDLLPSMPVHLHKRLMAEAWAFVDMSIKVSATKAVFVALDERYPALHPTRLRYLFPGIVPLLERTARRTGNFELAGLAYDLRDTKPEHYTTLGRYFGGPPRTVAGMGTADVPFMKWALPIASQTIAALALLTQKDPPADDKATVRFYRDSPWQPQDAPEGTQLEVLT